MPDEISDLLKTYRPMGYVSTNSALNSAQDGLFTAIPPLLRSVVSVQALKRAVIRASARARK